MRKAVLEASQRATQSGALKKITAGVELLPPAADSGVRFLLFEAQGAPPKPLATAEEAPKAPFRDPFAREHLERELFITQLHGTHNVVLNKFNVVDEHVVLPTIEYEEQEAPLSRADLRAMWTAMRALDAFAFFNCGYESGASQPHKHMQLMSYPSLKAFTGLDMPPLLHFIAERLRNHPMSSVVQLPELPFLHFLHRIEIDPKTESEDAADQLLSIYDAVLQQLNAREHYPDKLNRRASPLPVAYNLLLTQAFVFVIPRRHQRFEGIEVNSIGFIGSFFVRDAAQRAFFEAQGPMALLRQVSFPPPSC
ncbi:hypothetical protein PybrP1_006551 [[Pythium] brassicae (nom. inval.)]|nr:hypothetical protein PybrP1_006551 [[Pythium] brassicae (nom. inval.)]